MDKPANIAAKWMAIGLCIGAVVGALWLVAYYYLFGSTVWAGSAAAWLAVGMMYALFRATREAYLAGRAEAGSGQR
jgi:hypothetical protein